MAFNAQANTELEPDFEPLDQPERPVGLSMSGQMIGWAVFGGLVLVGFFFGIVTGYERPKGVAVSSAPKEKESPKPETPKPTPKVTPEVQPSPTTPNPWVTPPKEDTTPKNETPKIDPPKIDPPKIDSPPKKEEPKSEVVIPVSFRKDVVPILRKHCFECHGDGKGKPKGDVDLTSIAKMMKSPGKILVPGKPEQSDVYTSITQREMPDQGRPKPKPDELLVLKNWILSGAKERRRPVRHRKLTGPASRSRSHTPRSSGRAN